MVDSINGMNLNTLQQYQRLVYTNLGNSQQQKSGYDASKPQFLTKTTPEQTTKKINETAKTIKSTETTEAQTSEKNVISQTGGVVGQQVFHKVTFGRGSVISKLTKVTPFTVASAILGIDLEEDGKALSEGARTGKGGDFKAGYKKLFKKIDGALQKCLKDGSIKNVLGAMGQVLSSVPNIGSVAITNTLKYIGAGLNKIGAPKLAQALGTTCELVGAVLNSIGQGVVSSAKNLGGALISLFKGKPADALKSLKKLGQDFKKMGIKIKDKFLEALVSIKDFGKKVLQKIENFGKKAGKAIVDTGKKIVGGLKKGWEKFKGLFRRRR